MITKRLDLEILNFSIDLKMSSALGYMQMSMESKNKLRDIFENIEYTEDFLKKAEKEIKEILEKLDEFKKLFKTEEK